MENESIADIDHLIYVLHYAWDSNIEKLSHYTSEAGNTLQPSDDKDLRDWLVFVVDNIEFVDQEKRVLLLGKGVSFRIDEEKEWQYFCSLLPVFKSFWDMKEAPYNKPFWRWLVLQTGQEISTDRLAQLQRISMWTHIERYIAGHKKWLKDYQKVKSFFEEHGHSNVPHTKNRQLNLIAEWCDEERQYAKSSGSSPYTRALLELINFQFETDDVDHFWEKMFKELMLFHRFYGHSCVPEAEKDLKNYETPIAAARARQVHREEYGTLAQWLKRELKYSTYPAYPSYKRQRLESLNVFDQDKKKARWVSRFSAILDGSPVRSRNHRWIRAQSTAYLRGMLSPHCETLLLDFVPRFPWKKGQFYY